MYLFELIISNKPETKTNIQAYFITYFEVSKKNLKISIFPKYNDIKKRPKSLFYIEHVKFNTTSIPIYCSVIIYRLIMTVVITTSIANLL